MHEDGATQAPPPGLAGLVEGAVLGDYHHVNGDAMVTGLLRGQSEVEAVAGVVLHDEKHPGGSCGGEEEEEGGYASIGVFKSNQFLS